MNPTWLAETVEDRRTVFRVGREGREMIAEWPGFARLVADRTGSSSRFEVEHGADPELVRKLETGAVRALLRHLRGELTLHASAIARGDAAVAFMGDSGTGKSTLAYAATALREWSLLSDDCLFVDAGWALPTESAAWLDDDARRSLGLQSSRSGKLPSSVRSVGTKPAFLRKIVFLSYGERAVQVERLRGVAAAAPLARGMVRFVMDEPDVHRADMDRLADLVRRVDVLSVTRPRGLEHLPSTLDAIEEALGW